MDNLINRNLITVNWRCMCKHNCEIVNHLLIHSLIFQYIDNGIGKVGIHSLIANLFYFGSV